MTLQILAEQYKNQFLDIEYTIYTSDFNIEIRGYEDNFIHLLGLQDCLPPTIDKTKFFRDSLQGKNGDLKQYLSCVTNKEIRNMINIKSSYFYNMKNTIMNSNELYKNDNDFGFCVDFQSKKGNTKSHTILCKYDTALNLCVPKSNQIDKNSKYSNVNRYNYSRIPIINKTVKVR